VHLHRPEHLHRQHRRVVYHTVARSPRDGCKVAASGCQARVSTLRTS
jgi:hypothetical protein